MTDKMPERIWLDKKIDVHDKMGWHGFIASTKPTTDYTEPYIRADAHQAELEALRKENNWAMTFECPTCGPCSPAMIRTDKSCSYCGSNLIRGVHPRVEALRKVAEAAKHWQKCKLAESDFPPTEQLVLIQRNTRDAEQGLMFAIAALRELESE